MSLNRKYQKMEKNNNIIVEKYDGLKVSDSSQSSL